MREIEYFREVKSGDLSVRRDQLIEFLLTRVEKRIFSKGKSGEVRDRVRGIRTEIISQYFSTNAGAAEKKRLRYDSVAAELAQDLLSYPDCYLQPEQVTDTRIVETIQRMQETFFGEADASVPLKVVIQFDEPIVVPAEKAPRGQADPLLNLLRDRLTTALEQLSNESRPMEVRLPDQSNEESA